MHRAVVGLILCCLLGRPGCCGGPACCPGKGCTTGGCFTSGLQSEHGPACGCGHCIHCRRAGALEAARRLLVCHNGCGDLYYDEWFSDPPAPRDPCDFCYQPGPLRQLYRNLCYMHTAPRPGCYVPVCDDDCPGEAGHSEDWPNESDESFVEEAAPRLESVLQPAREVLPPANAQPMPAPHSRVPQIRLPGTYGSRPATQPVYDQRRDSSLQRTAGRHY